MAQHEERSTGIVLWFNDSKGFGFIKLDDGGEGLFVHHSSITVECYRKLFEGDVVEFQISLGPEGKTQAIDVIIKKKAGGRSGGGYGVGRRENDTRSNGAGYGCGAGGAGCYNCGDPNHLARDCSRGGNNGGSCYNCGDRGHFARDCTVENNGGGKSCYNCGEYGHMARDCGSIRGGGGNTGGGCYNCGDRGHLARECRSTGGSGGRFERERGLAAAAAAATIAGRLGILRGSVQPPNPEEKSK